MPTDKQIDDVLEACRDLEGESNFEALTFEDGVRDAILWMQSQGPNPITGE